MENRYCCRYAKKYATDWCPENQYKSVYDAGKEDTGAWDTSYWDTGAVPDAGPQDTAPIPGEAGWPCKEDGECDSLVCLVTGNGKMCASACTDGCPTGQWCRQVAGGSYVCVDEMAFACDPCTSNKDCAAPGFADSKCLSHGAAGTLCGRDCATVACPAGYACEDRKALDGTVSKQCVPWMSSCSLCSKHAAAVSLTVACTPTSVPLPCDGTRTCSQPADLSKPASLTACACGG